jgi:hypothetical protein
VICARFFGLFGGMQRVAQKDQARAGETLCHRHGGDPPSHALPAKEKSSGCESGMILEFLYNGLQGRMEEGRTIRSLPSVPLEKEIKFDAQKTGVGEALVIGLHEDMIHVISRPMRQNHRIALTWHKVFGN